jgi:hypothetical protein
MVVQSVNEIWRPFHRWKFSFTLSLNDNPENLRDGKCQIWKAEVIRRHRLEFELNRRFQVQLESQLQQADLKATCDSRLAEERNAVTEQNLHWITTHSLEIVEGLFNLMLKANMSLPVPNRQIFQILHSFWCAAVYQKIIPPPISRTLGARRPTTTSSLTPDLEGSSGTCQQLAQTNNCLKLEGFFSQLFQPRSSFLAWCRSSWDVEIGNNIYNINNNNY